MIANIEKGLFALHFLDGQWGPKDAIREEVIEPLTASLIIILGEYALDKAAGIIPVVGGEGARIVRLLCDFVTG